MARNFLFGLGWVLIITTILGFFASFDPDNKISPIMNFSALGLRVLVAIAVFYFANRCVPTKSRWPAIGMWLLGFLIGFPLGNLVINAAIFAVNATLR